MAKLIVIIAITGNQVFLALLIIVIRRRLLNSRLYFLEEASF